MKLSLLALVALCPSVNAQVTTLWSNQQPTPGFPIETFVGTHLALGASQDAYLAGTGYSNGVDSVRLARIAPDGTTLWSVHAPLSAQNVCGLVVSQQDGSAMIGLGGVQGFMTMKFDASGAFLASSPMYNGPLAENGAAKAAAMLATDAANNVYLCGSVRMDATYVDWDACVVSFDPQGSLRFATLIPGPLARQDRATGVFYDANSGGVVVVGTFDADNEYSGRSSFIARVSNSGAVTSVTSHSASPQNFVSATGNLDGQGRVRLLRRKGSTSTSYSVTDLTSYDASDLPIGSLPFDYAVARPTTFDVAEDGTVVVCGYMNSGGQPGFVARLNPNLQLVSQAFLSLSGASSHYFSDVRVESNGDATVSGFVSWPQSGLGQISVPLVNRLDSAGNTRWSSMDLVGSLSGFPGRPIVDESGRTWVAIQRTAGAFGNVETRAIQPQSHSLCHGDAAATACPCGNSSSGLAQAGCANSTGGAGKLADSGNASVASDSLVFTCSGLDSTAIALLAEATSVTQPLGFGDGLRCFGGSLSRLYVKPASGGTVAFPGAGDPSILSQSGALGGTITPGAQRLYQVYYRDASLSFCSAPSGGTFNLSNALLVYWGS